MLRQIITTADGSHSLYVPALNESYHSRNGAVTESEHVYLQAGLQPLLHRFPILHILEIGFGTGLNAWLTLQQATAQGQVVHYHSLEPFPLSPEEAAPLNYAADDPLFTRLHTTPWEQDVAITPAFTLHKSKAGLADFAPLHLYHLIYFDAFAPEVQPELWEPAIFQKLYHCLQNGGLLTTYSSKSRVRRAVQEAGFAVEKLAGPPGKREMIRAAKL